MDNPPPERPRQTHRRSGYNRPRKSAPSRAAVKRNLAFYRDMQGPTPQLDQREKSK